MTAARNGSPEAPGTRNDERLPFGVRIRILARLLALQSSWNYETLIGNGTAFALDPALRRLPGGTDGAAYRAAMAREARYFNAHPYLASLAVGALARAELDAAPPEQIERFRNALVGPLGSVGDQLFWAGWLPCCAMIALLAYGLGGSSLFVVLLFLGAYNAGHIAMRVWGLEAGWRSGLRLAGALAHPVLREGPRRIASATLVLAGLALPLAAARIIGGAALGSPLLRWVLPAGALVMAVALVRLRGRVEGWKAAFGVLLLLVIYSVLR
jgi:PTS system mannose-specific IID component